jgi:hypothetical protein
MSLTLLLTLDKARVTKDRLPEATVRLINESNELVIANARLLLAPRGMPSRLHELAFNIKGPEGSINLKRVHINAGPPDIGNFVRLFPGEYIFQSYELSEYFKYTVPGKYTIVAEYSNDTEVKVHETKSWTGKISSNEATFEITNE